MLSVTLHKAMKYKNFVLSCTAQIAKILPGSYKQALYSNPIMSRMIRNSLNRIAPQGLSKVSIAAGGIEGLEMNLDLQSEKDYWLGTYESELQEAIEDWVKPGHIIYDIGANIGYITLLFAKRTGSEGHVYAFEALPANVNRLSSNIEVNNYQERVTIIEAAVQDRTGSSEFLVGPSHGMGKVQGSAGRNSFEYDNKIQVDGVSIDDFIDNSNNPPPDIIKIDIEGGEVLALPGMNKLLKERHPIVFIELHGSEAAQVSWDVMKTAGYGFSQMESQYPEISSFQDLDWKSYLVAFPDD